MLASADGPSSLAVSLSTATKLFEGRINTVAANGVSCGRSALLATMSQFPELEADLEVLVSGCSVGLTEDKADALWTRVRVASDSLASHVPSSVCSWPTQSGGSFYM
jgi:hypothetical protein